MQTDFTAKQLADPLVARSEKILRTCVHCGFCTATCPTYQVLGDELDSPRGRIYLIKDMLENDRDATALVTQHIDRCLSCLSCMTTCPSGVDYMHLVDHAREHIEKTHKRPLIDRLMRKSLGRLMPDRRLFRLAMIGGWFARPFRFLLPDTGPLKRLRAMLALTPFGFAPREAIGGPGFYASTGTRKGHVAVLDGCVQAVVGANINAATVRFLTRHGYDVSVLKQAGCCGSLNHHMGQTTDGLSHARRTIAAWTDLHQRQPLDAVVINSSGCGNTIKDYGVMFAEDPDWREQAQTIAGLARDVLEFIDENRLMPELPVRSERVTYHAACSLQHGQRIKDAPQKLLERAGFRVSGVRDSHLCCGSAGTYNMLQPEISSELRRRKQETIAETAPDIVAAGNLGCMMQIGQGFETPVVHSIELLDWATGGPQPVALTGL